MRTHSCDNDATIEIGEAIEIAHELAVSRFGGLSDKLLNDFVGILSYMAGDRNTVFVSELVNAIENFGHALIEGDVSMLAQPRGLRTSRIVDVQEFVESKFFMGQRGYVRPKVLEKLWELFHGENAENHLEVVLGGGIGWGKSFFGEMSLGYMLYKLSCYHCPQMEFGLAPGSSIYFVTQSVKEDLAKKVLFGQFSHRLRRSEYFSKFFPYDPNVLSELRFPNDISIIPRSSSDTSALGLNVFGGILDELNFMSRVIRPSSSRFTGEQEYDQAEKLYSTIVRRMKSRFNVKGRVPGKILLISSANYPGDFIDRKMQEQEAEIAAEGSSSIFVVKMAQWESLPPDRLSEEKFLVEVGDATRSSRIIESMEEAVDPESVIEVPVDYKSDFKSDLESALRDLAGIPIGGTGAFIKRRELIEKAAKTHEELFDGKQLFSRSVVDLTNFSGDLVELIDREYMASLLASNSPLVAHVDLALTGDSCGLALGHFGGFAAVGKTTNWDEERNCYVEAPAGEEPVAVIDGVLEIIPPKVDEIDINIVGDLLEVINSRLLLEIVTADSFQSAAFLQRMRKIRNLRGRRVRSGMLSVDTSIAPYSEVKQALRDSRLIYPNVEKLKKELRELNLDPLAKKVDHPVGGSKDLADAAASVTYLVLRRNSTKSLKGAAGRKILAGLDAPEETVQEQPSRPTGSGRRLH